MEILLEYEGFRRVLQLQSTSSSEEMEQKILDEVKKFGDKEIDITTAYSLQKWSSK